MIVSPGILYGISLSLEKKSSIQSARLMPIWIGEMASGISLSLEKKIRPLGLHG
jgi:hypothetical protein